MKTQIKGDGWFHGERVQLAREFHGMSIAELARKMKVSSYRVRLWESDEEKPSFEERVRLGWILQFTPDFFMQAPPPPFGQVIMCGSGGCEIYDGPE